MNTAENKNNLPLFLLTQLSNIAHQEGFQDYSVEENIGSSLCVNFMASLISVSLVGPRKINNQLKTDNLALICKVLPPNTERQEQSNSTLVFEREVNFYKNILPMLQNFQSENGLTEENGFFGYPHCYATVNNAEKNEYAIIMKDLRSDGYGIWNKAEPITIENAQLAMEQLGRLHGLSFALRDQRPFEFNEVQELNDVLLDVLKTKMMTGMFEGALDDAITILNDDPNIEVIRMLRETYHEWLTECFVPSAAEPFAVLGHGDTWINNMMFTTSPKKVCLLDWQLCRFASPALDIAYYFLSSTDKNLRDSHYDRCIQIYYDNLSEIIRKCGSEPEKLFTFSDLQEQLRKFGKFGVYYAPITLAILISDSSNITNLDVLAESGSGKNFVKFDKKSELKFRKRLIDALEDAKKFGWV